MPTRRTIDAAVSATLEWIEDALEGDVAMVADRAAAEDAYARLAVKGLLNLSPADLRRRSRLSGYEGVLVVQRLLDTFDATWNCWTPLSSLTLADAAVTIASRCDRASPALLFRAWKERANALRVVNCFDEAFRSLDKAETFAHDTKCPRLHHAVLANCRISVHLEMGSSDLWDLLFQAREASLACGDLEHVKWTRTTEPALCYSLGRYETAIQIYHAILAEAAREGDQQLVAMEIGNIGLAYLRLGDVKAARSYLDRARDLYSALGMVVQRTKMHTSLGQLAMREQGMAGLAVLNEACLELDRNGMTGEWAFARLAMAEEILRIDSNADVTGLCREAHTRALSLGMHEVAANALLLLDTVERRGPVARLPM